MEPAAEVDATSVGVALSGLNGALTTLIDVVEDGGLDQLAVMGVVEAIRGFEQIRNRMALVDHRVVSDCERRQVAGELNLRTTRALLVNVLRLSSLEAGRRVRAAAAVGARTSMVGETMEPMRPVLAAAQRQGEVTPEQVSAVEESLRDLEDLDVDPEKVDAAEQTLVEYARVFDPRALTRVGEKLADIDAPDGKAPDDSVLQLKRRFQMATGRDGAVRGKFCLTPDVGAALAAVLSPLAKPRLDPPVDGGHLADTHKDSRTSEQRMHDAFGDLCSWALRGGGLGTPEGATPTTTDPERDRDRDRDEQTHGQEHGNTSDPLDRDQQDRDEQDHDDPQSGDKQSGDPQSGDKQSSDPHFGDPHFGDRRADADLFEADLSGADLSGADLSGADLSGAREDQAGADQAGADQAGAGESAATTAHDQASPGQPPTRPGPPPAPATVIIIIDINDLINRTGAGETSFGAFLSPEQILRIANEAEIYPVVITATGVPLHLGRTRRIATRSQSMALVARDGGCSFPGCDHPPEWCDRHHITAWIDGGATDLDNLTLLCRYHHTRFLGKGWTCHINADGVPAWTPPRWQDPTQTPIVHLRILRRQLERRIEGSRTRRSSDGTRSTTSPPSRARVGEQVVPAVSDPHCQPPAPETLPSTTPPSTAPPSTRPPSTTPVAATEGGQAWLDVVAADLRRAQLVREALLSAAAEERGRRLGPLWCPDEDDDLNAFTWTDDEIREAGWTPANPHPERLAPPWTD